jgi:putative hydrolase of the HAD superfamily
VKTLVLDAMGVIYRADDDVAELLVPFVGERGGTTDVHAIERAYHAASLGLLDPDRFWRDVGLDPVVENDYLELHELTTGLERLLDEARASGARLWCLSNDVGRWSEKLRRRFGIEASFEGFVISSTIGARKPDPAAYRALLDRVRVPARQILFVDDREANIAAARTLGIDARLFTGFDTLIDHLRS